MPRSEKPPLSAKDSTRDFGLSDEMASRWNGLLAVEATEALDPGSIQALAEDLDGNPALVDLLIEKIVSRPGLSTGRLLLSLQERVSSKTVRKAIKRTLYLLKQKGQDFSSEMETNDRKGSPGILRERAPAQVSGYLSEFDGSRSRMAALVIPKEGQGKVLVFALIDPERNLESLTALEVNKKEARRILEELGEEAGNPFLTADPGHVAFILKEAHDHRSYLSQEDEKLWSLIQNLLMNCRTMGDAPLLRSLFPPDPVTHETPLDMSRFLNIPEMDYYVFKAEAVEPYRQAVQDVLEGVLVLSREQKRERLQAIVHKAAEAIFRSEESQDLVRYLEEVAYIYYLKAQMDVAHLLFSGALSLWGQPGAEANPLLIFFVEKTLLRDKNEDFGTPETSKTEISPGGIIIPPWINREGEGR